ncbi:MAG: glycosyltransferase family 4 protein [Chitinophagaceae bacterium]|nr:glycosyltransferase family 4 protein [Chitinophagaceae bacterium]
MKIGFDAKRAYHNATGLGYYSRTLIQSMSEFYPEHQYFLFNPKASDQFSFKSDHLVEIRPRKFLHKWITPLWRTFGITPELKRLGIDLYHGLSHEIPAGIRSAGIRSVVTIHDLMPERFPEQYHALDAYTYKKKTRYACEQADKIICVSRQTQEDVMEFYGVDESRTTVCYESCDPVFGIPVSEEEKNRVSDLYCLPDRFFLSVGSVIERKNLLNTCKAFLQLKDKVDLPLVVVGSGGEYQEKVKDFILRNGMEDRVIFLSSRRAGEKFPGFLCPNDLAVIYQSAVALIYPSLFEGFGLPVLEALNSRLPVITSCRSSMSEITGEAALLVEPGSVDEIADAIERIYTDTPLALSLAEKGLTHARLFTGRLCAENVMRVYQELW